MSKTDRELFDELSKGSELTAEDGVTEETEFEVVTEAEPEDEPETVEAEEAEAQETEAEADVDAETDEGEPEPEVEAEEDEEPKGVQIPKAQYDRIRGKQKEAEALAEQRSQENAALQGRLEQIERLLTAQAQAQAQPAQPQEPVEEPDPITDPEGYARLIDARIQQQVQQVERRFIQGSLDRARETYGEEAEKAFAFVDQHGTPELAEAMRNSGDPGAQIVKYYRRQVALSEVGDDPSAYRARLEAEIQERLENDPAFIEKALAKQRGTATTRTADGRPAIQTPPSLARGSRAADARPQTDDPIEGMSDEAIFAKLSRTG